MKVTEYILAILILGVFFYSSTVLRMYLFEGEVVFNIFTKQRTFLYLTIAAVVVVAFWVKGKLFGKGNSEQPWTTIPANQSLKRIG